MLADLAKPLGVPAPWRDELWPTFERLILNVIIEAQSKLQSANICQPTWKENQFSAALLLHIWEIRDEGPESNGVPYSFVPQDESRLLLEKIMRGEVVGVDADNAPRIDLVFRHCGMKRSVYFGVEAKVLTNKTIGSRKPGASVKGYVDEGMMRFVDGRYSTGLQSGAMVGFVISGTHAELASKIEKEVIAVKLPFSKNLVLVANEPLCSGHYHSQHPRTLATEVGLHHLLFQMIFSGPSGGETQAFHIFKCPVGRMRVRYSDGLLGSRGRRRWWQRRGDGLVRVGRVFALAVGHARLADVDCSGSSGSQGPKHARRVAVGWDAARPRDP